MANPIIGEGAFSFHRVVEIFFSEDTSNYVSENWRSLAQKLGLHLDRIEDLDKQCRQGNKRKKDVVHLVLEDWKMRTGNQAKLLVLLSTLQSLNWNNILQKMKNEFGVTQSQFGAGGNMSLQPYGQKNFPLAWLDDALYAAERKRQADAIMNSFLIAVMKSTSGLSKKNEQTLIDECSIHIQKPTVIGEVLNDMFNLFKAETVKNKPEALQAILKVMRMYERDVVIQISGMGCLIFIVNQTIKEGVFKNIIHPLTKSAIIGAVANGLRFHYLENDMVNNACIAFQHFQVPEDIMLIYDDLLTILVKIFAETKLKASTELKCLQLFYSMVYGVDKEVKKSVGTALVVALASIMNATQEIAAIDDECIQRVDTAWLILVTLTNLQPENCRIFLDHHGIKFFVLCIAKFVGTGVNVVNILITLGNVVMVPALRRQFIHEDLLLFMTELLVADGDKIHLSFAAAYILANILNEGESAWTLTNPKRLTVQMALLKNVIRWDINTTRRVEYNSLECLLKLIRVKHTKESKEYRLWAAWELANLIKTNPDLYVPLIYKENGIPIINEVWDSVKRSKDPTKKK